MNYTLKNEFYAATVSSLGAEMISLKGRDGRELLWQNNLGEGWANHAPLLFPFAGRLKDNEFIYGGRAYPMKIHGFADASEFSLESKTETEITLSLSSSEETRELFPFDFLFTATYTLDGESVRLTVKVENTGKKSLPYVFGWHPGFLLPSEDGQDIEDYAVKFKDKAEIVWAHGKGGILAERHFTPYPVSNSEYRLCENEIYENDTMIFLEAGNEVTLKADGHPYELNMSWSENLPVLCIWKIPRNEAKFICIEPWTHLSARGERSNYLDERPMHRLESGKADTYEYTLKFKQD